MRSRCGEQLTVGLSDDVIAKFCTFDNNLVRAIEEASSLFNSLPSTQADEATLVEELQSDFINFYAQETINPYVALAARGPWVVTAHGAVLHDNGGYGMLGGGHGPDEIIDAMSKNWVMANVMTPSFSQKRLADGLRKELGHTRGSCPFSKFICMNSGSEAVTVACRISDVNSLRMTREGGRHAGKPTKLLAIEKAFHGRTDRPAQLSHSCLPSYDANLATFRDRDTLILVPSNDVESLRAAFAKADAEDYFIELVALEPVQGEGNPGQCVSREFYDEARRLTLEHGSMLLVDSIQAGIRGQGCLSIIDYAGFEDCQVPDLETWSKALNAGQYPLSVLGLSPRASELYVVGIYGNTMTTNPRALETAVAVLDKITPELKQRIRSRGKEFLGKLETLAAEFPSAILKTQGTGLLLSMELDSTKMKVVGHDQVEVWCRKNGLGVIHGGENALRYTPHFGITSEEIDLVIDITRQAIKKFLE
ncbi:MAG: aminotransferase class III-fold pyridoxal phosphate-dependent enzyme [Euryarchaeota archaeon]|jgi:acetylornithine/succinyldiaminopimelate/putrescine aminotransferase|nr:aminotransferase class III-fold pyridoxal phosphate-dependent enzyme [Euryarchaeota archaeon]